METKSIWWHNPKFRSDAESDHERAATPLELFYDLIFVAAIATLAHELSHDMKEHPSFKVLVTYVFLFIPIWWVWIGNTFYTNRFQTNDIGHRLATFIQMAGVGGLAFFAHQGLDPEGTKGFALSYAFCRIVIIALWWRGGYYNRQAMPMIKILTYGFGSSVILFTASVFVEPPFRFYLWGIGLLLDLVTPFFSIKEQQKLPGMSMEHIRERFGLLTIIVLGESVAGAVYGMANAHDLDLPVAIAALLGLGLACMLWFHYFDQMMNTMMSENRYIASLWYYLHLPLMMALTGVGAGMLAIIGSPGITLSPAISWLIGGSVAASFFLFGILELLSEGWVDDMGKPKKFFIVRGLSTVGALFVALEGHHMDAILALGILFALALIQVVIGVYYWVQAVKTHGEDYRHGWSID